MVDRIWPSLERLYAGMTASRQTRNIQLSNVPVEIKRLP